MDIIKLIIGIAIFMSGFLMLISNFPQYYYFENDNQKHNLNVSDNITFEFSKLNIKSYYNYYDNQKEHTVFLNLVSNDLSIDGYAISYIYFNDCLFADINETAYINSFAIDKICINENIQNILIDTNATIDSINLEYKGSNQNNSDIYNDYRFYIIIFLLLVGIFIIINGAI